MRIVKFGVLAAAIAWCLLPSFGFAADVAKIGVVDDQRILENSSAGKAAKSMLKKKFDKMKADLTKKGDEIEQLKKQLERERLVMSQEKLDSNERDLRIKINDLKLMQKRYNDDMKKTEMKIMNSITKDLIPLVEEIGRKQGYLLILRKKPFVFYAPQSIDLTDQVIQEYNAMFAKGAAEASKVLK